MRSMASTTIVVFAVALATGVLGVQSLLSRPPPPLTIANMFGDHMVLQQAPAQASVWGLVVKCDSTLTATFDGKTYTPKTTPGPNGGCIWTLTLPPTKTDAKKTYTISVTSSKYGSIKLSDVMFGDVWVCGGQSNMQFSVTQAYNPDEEVEDASNYPLIRLFTASLVQSNAPQSQLLGIEQPWSIASPKSVGGGNWTYFSAACWFYGRDLFKILKYPIGLVASNWGGTPVEAWSSPDALAKCKKVEQTQLEETPAKTSRVEGPSQASVLWNAMIRPLINMTIKGAVWYQGEANAGDPASYNCTFPAMIDDWRAKWAEGTNNQTTPLYFGFVQLAPSGSSNVTVGGFPGIRWSQTASYGYVPNKRLVDVFMAVAIDLGDPTSPFGSIHPRDKQDVGSRLAVGALSVAYKNTEVYYLGMLPQSAKMSVGAANVLAVAVTFGPPNKRAKLELRYHYGFEVGCGTSGSTPTQWIEGTAKSVTDSDVNVEFPLCPSPSKPLQVRYCWRTDPCLFGKCPIYSSLTNPSPPFIMNL